MVKTEDVSSTYILSCDAFWAVALGLSSPLTTANNTACCHSEPLHHFRMSLSLTSQQTPFNSNLRQKGGDSSVLHLLTQSTDCHLSEMCVFWSASHRLEFEARWSVSSMLRLWTLTHNFRSYLNTKFPMHVYPIQSNLNLFDLRPFIAILLNSGAFVLRVWQWQVEDNILTAI